MRIEQKIWEEGGNGAMATDKPVIQDGLCRFLLFILILLLAPAPSAAALEVKAGGQVAVQFGLRDNYHNENGAFMDGEADRLFVRQRSRIRVDFIASENLRGVIQAQAGTINWGNEKQGGALDTTSAELKVRQAYVEWLWPESELTMKMGLQLIILPSAVSGNPVLSSTLAAVKGSWRADDRLSLTAFWGRPYHADTEESRHNDMDLFALLADFAPGESLLSLRAQPYLMYGRIGQFSGYGKVRPGTASPWAPQADKDQYFDYYLGGLALELEPAADWSLGLDALYLRQKNRADDLRGGVDKYEGWFLAGKAERAFSFGTLGAVAWYASGNDKDAFDPDGRRYGRIPSISLLNSGFDPTRLAFNGAFCMGDDGIISDSGAGTWGAGLHLKNLSFTEDLKHTFRFFYFSGTDKEERSGWRRDGGRPDATELNRKDHAFEVDFDSSWTIYENLRLVVETAYVYLDWDKDAHAGYGLDKNNVWNVQFTFDYRF